MSGPRSCLVKKGECTYPLYPNDTADGRNKGYLHAERVCTSSFGVLVAIAFHSVLSFFLKARIREIEDHIVGDPFVHVRDHGVENHNVGDPPFNARGFWVSCGSYLFSAPLAPLH